LYLPERLLEVGDRVRAAFGVAGALFLEEVVDRRVRQPEGVLPPGLRVEPGVVQRVQRVGVERLGPVVLPDVQVEVVVEEHLAVQIHHRDGVQRGVDARRVEVVDEVAGDPDADRVGVGGDRFDFQLDLGGGFPPGDFLDPLGAPRARERAAGHGEDRTAGGLPIGHRSLRSLSHPVIIVPRRTIRAAGFAAALGGSVRLGHRCGYW